MSAGNESLFCSKLWRMLYFMNVIFSALLNLVNLDYFKSEVLQTTESIINKDILKEISVISRIISGSKMNNRYIMHCILSITGSK